MTDRPRIAIPTRFSQSASALRYRAEVTARALVEAVFAAGGEPLMLHPHAPGGRVRDDEVAARLAVADGVLLPGGGDLAAHWSGQEPHPTQYDVDDEQDAFDLAIARVTIARGIPLLAVCRGMQVVSVARGGSVVQEMAEHPDHGTDHRHVRHSITVSPPLATLLGEQAEVSCYHHQCIDRPGEGLRPIAWSEGGVVEAVDLPEASGWFLGVQWHPEDTAASDPAQAALFAALVDASASRADATRRLLPQP